MLARQEYNNCEYRIKYSVFRAEKAEENYDKFVQLLLENILEFDKFGG